MTLKKWLFTTGTFLIGLSILFLLLYVQSVDVFIKYTYDNGGQYLVSLDQTSVEFNKFYLILSYLSLFFGTTSTILGIVFPFKKT